MQVLKHKGVTYINDAYNANPDSMAVALHSLSQWQSAGRKIAVLGDMLELGESSQTQHAGVGEKAATSNLAYLVTVGQHAKAIAQAAAKAGMPSDHIKDFATREDAFKALAELIQKEDVLLFKGSRGAGMEQILKQLTKSK